MAFLTSLSLLVIACLQTVCGSTTAANSATSCTADTLTACTRPQDMWGAAEFCTKWQVYSSCVNAISCSADDSLLFNVLSAIGDANANLYLCTPEAKPVLSRSGLCMYVNYINSSEACWSASFPADLTGATDLDYCRYYSDYYACEKQEIVRACGSDTLSFLENYFNISTQPLQQAYCLPKPTMSNATSCTADALKACMRPNILWGTPYFCSKWQAYSSCVKAISCSSTDAELFDVLSAVGDANANLYLCSPETQRVLARSGVCMYYAFVYSVTPCYTFAFPANLAGATVADYCRYYHKFYACLTYEIVTNCGNNTLDFVEKYFDISTQPLQKAYCLTTPPTTAPSPKAATSTLRPKPRSGWTLWSPYRCVSGRPTQISSRVCVPPTKTHRCPGASRAGYVKQLRTNGVRCAHKKG